MSDLQCYCCGKPLGQDFALVSMKEEADRVFVVRTECVHRVDDPEVIVHVQRMETR